MRGGWRTRGDTGRSGARHACVAAQAARRVRCESAANSIPSSVPRKILQTPADRPPRSVPARDAPPQGSNRCSVPRRTRWITDTGHPTAHPSHASRSRPMPRSACGRGRPVAIRSRSLPSPRWRTFPRLVWSPWPVDFGRAHCVRALRLRGDRSKADVLNRADVCARCRIIHSCRSASMGSNRAARRAGKYPNTTPTVDIAGSELNRFRDA